METNLPQQFLDQIHELDIPSLFHEQMEPDAREKAVKLMKQKLRLIRKSVNQEITAIKARWDGRKTGEAEQERLHLIPFQLLIDLIERLDIALGELDVRGVLAEAPSFGTQIVGNHSRGDWQILSPADALRWQADDAQRTVDEHKALVPKLQRSINSWTTAMEKKQRSQRLAAGLLAVVGIPLIGAAFVVMGNMRNTIFILILTAGTLVFGAAILYVNSTRPDPHTAAQIAKARAELDSNEHAIKEFQTLSQRYRSLYDETTQQS